MGRIDREDPYPRNSSRDPYIGRVDSNTAGRDGSIGLSETMPPRRRITSKGSPAGSADSDRSRSATAATAAVAGLRRALPMASACSVAASTSSRRLTSHQIRIGAVRQQGRRSACDASHQTGDIQTRGLCPGRSARRFLQARLPKSGNLRCQARLPRERIAPVDRRGRTQAKDVGSDPHGGLSGGAPDVHFHGDPSVLMGQEITILVTWSTMAASSL